MDIKVDKQWAVGHAILGEKERTGTLYDDDLDEGWDTDYEWDPPSDPDEPAPQDRYAAPAPTGSVHLGPTLTRTGC